MGEEIKTAGIYVASRASVLARGAMWRAHRAAGAPIISTWIDEDGENDTADLDELWTRINREVTGARLLVLYVEADDFPLKGAFVEIGMALAAGVPIKIVAPGVELIGRNLRPLGSWVKHPLVSFSETVEEALQSENTRLLGEDQGSASQKPTTSNHAGSLPANDLAAAAVRIERALGRFDGLGLERTIAGREGPGLLVEDLRTVLAAVEGWS